MFSPFHRNLRKKRRYIPTDAYSCHLFNVYMNRIEAIFDDKVLNRNLTTTTQRRRRRQQRCDMTTTPIISTRQSLVHFCLTPTIEPNEDGIVNFRPVFLLCVADSHTLSLSHTQLFLLCFYTPSRSPLLTIDMFNHSFYFLFLSLRYTFSFSRSCFPTHSLTHFIELHVNRNETFSA